MNKTLISDTFSQRCIKFSGAVVFIIEIRNTHEKTTRDF